MKVLITGASKGIGYSLAEHYRNKGYEVYGTARTSPKDWDEKNFFCCDLSNSNELDSFFEFVKEKAPFDICIHNFGLNHSGPFLQSSEKKIRQMSFANFTLPALLTQLLLKEKLLSEKASLIYLNSLSHFVSYPGSSIYAATKAGLHSLVRSLRLTYSQHHFMSVYPGPVETEQARKNSPLDSNSKRMCPDQLAHQIEQARMKKKNYLIPGALAQTLSFLSKIAPTFVESLMFRAVFMKMKNKTSTLRQMS